MLSLFSLMKLISSAFPDLPDEDESSSDNPFVELHEWTKVRARYCGGSNYYPGVINRDCGDGTYDISYLDGDQERCVAAALIKGRVEDNRGHDNISSRGKQLHKGSRVQARCRDSVFRFPGLISCDHGDGTYDVDYDNGDHENRVAAELLSEDSDAESGEDASNMRANAGGSLLREGSRVMARFDSRRKFYPGVIARDHGDSTYDIDYDDGEQETRVSVGLIDAGRSGVWPSYRSEFLREGSKVKARFKGKGLFYSGVISCDHGDGTFDVDYDDGDYGTRVAAEMIGGGWRDRDGRGKAHQLLEIHIAISFRKFFSLDVIERMHKTAYLLRKRLVRFAWRVYAACISATGRCSLECVGQSSAVHRIGMFDV